MKRCPECRRDYYDDSLIYCLDDGSALLDGPGFDRTPTAVLPVRGDDTPTLIDGLAETPRRNSPLPSGDLSSKRSARTLFSWRNGVVAVLVLAALAAIFFY